MKNKTNLNACYRQGDVLIQRVPSLPSKLTPVARERGRVILAHGEVTGHAHAITDEHVDLFTTADEAGVTYLEVRDAMAALHHDEHSTIELPPGNYRVTRQREFTPEAIRPVAD